MVLASPRLASHLRTPAHTEEVPPTPLGPFLAVPGPALGQSRGPGPGGGHEGRPEPPLPAAGRRRGPPPPPAHPPAGRAPGDALPGPARAGAGATAPPLGRAAASQMAAPGAASPTAWRAAYPSAGRGWEGGPSGDGQQSQPIGEEGSILLGNRSRTVGGRGEEGRAARHPETSPSMAAVLHLKAAVLLTLLPITETETL